MIRVPPDTTRTDSLCPYRTLFRAPVPAPAAGAAELCDAGAPTWEGPAIEPEPDAAELWDDGPVSWERDVSAAAAELSDDSPASCEPDDRVAASAHTPTRTATNRSACAGKAKSQACDAMVAAVATASAVARSQRRRPSAYQQPA